MSESTSGHITPAIAELAKRLQAAIGDGYEVERALGAGAFAVVFLVHDVRLKRRLAVKVLSPDVVTSRSVIERFRREAETVAQLKHPNIVPLYYFGGTDDLLFLVMEWMDGGSLADRLKRQPSMSIEETTRVVTEVAGALAHAHKRGVVHRDIKPQNVLLDAESGRALVADFGIARTDDSASLTATGLVLGTPAYLAPEQVTGEASDHRADIYALGVMTYEMLAGRRPFEAPTAAAAAMKRLGGPPEPLSAIRSDVPQALQQVIDGCLAVDPAERFQSGAEIVSLLTGHTPRSGGHVTSVARIAKRRQRGIWIGAGGVVLGAAIVSLIVLNGKSSAVPPPLVEPVDSGMVVFPAGAYLVGSDSGPASAPFRPAHRVTLPSFGFDRHEVTVAAYQEYVDSGKATSPWPPNAMPAPALPVTRVRFADALNYCRWKHPDGGRLPTEEEWEAAARGMTGRKYPWGTDPVVGRANVQSTGRNAPVPVGTFASGATTDGVVDLIGNVWEWTNSPMAAYPNGPPLADSLAQYRVVRGGAFNSPDALVTSWWRVAYPPSASPELLDKTGFRCAMNTRAASGLAPGR